MRSEEQRHATAGALVLTGSIVCRGGAGAGLGSSAAGGAGSCHHGEHCHTYTGSRPYTCRVYSITVYRMSYLTKQRKASEKYVKPLL